MIRIEVFRFNGLPCPVIHAWRSWDRVPGERQTEAISLRFGPVAFAVSVHWS